MTQVTYSQNISKKSFLSKTGNLFIRMGRRLTKRNTIIEIICSLFIILFIYTGINKIMDFAKFKFEMGRSPFLQNISEFVAITIPPAELLIALMLIIKRTRLLGLYVSFFLMTLFTGYVWIMLHYAYDLPCSCGGIIQKMTWNQHLYFNALFTTFALIGTLIENNKATKV